MGISLFPPKKNIVNNYNLALNIELFNDCENEAIADRGVYVVIN